VRKSDAFDRLFAQSIDEAFGELFGEGAKKALYRFLEHKYSIDLNAVSGSLDDFSSALQELFGVGGGRTVERLLIRRLYSKVGLGPVTRDQPLPRAVEIARTWFHAKAR